MIYPLHIMLSLNALQCADIDSHLPSLVVALPKFQASLSYLNTNFRLLHVNAQSPYQSMCFEALDCTPAIALWPITARGIRARDLRRRALSDLGEKRERGSLAAQRERCMSRARFGYQNSRFVRYTGAYDAWGPRVTWAFHAWSM
jgi:hypothetical protein